jgi:aryl-alcohol dehydrogenase-like predicted oxidoreductase
MNMRSRPLGHSGIEVSTLALGTMMFGSWGNSDESECHRMVDMAIDAGVTLFDTADIYDAGVSEHILGDALRGRRGKVVLATKCGNPMDDDPAHRGLSKRWVVQACEDSLRRLDVEYIDLFQMHRPDADTPIDETIEAFDGLIAAGKIRAYGTSTFSAAQLSAAYAAANAAGSVAPTSEQPPYSILARGIETDVLPVLTAAEVGAIVWAPLNGGWLTGKYQNDARPEEGSRAERKPEHFDHGEAAIRAAKLRAVDALQVIADNAGISLVQLALGFVLASPTVSAAIIGPRTLPQLAQLLEAGHVDLDADVLAAIDQVVAPGVNINPANAG